MLFFRSEEQVRAWCEAGGHPVRPTVDIPTLWELARTWYGTRLQPISRRPGPDEMREIFERLGLTDAVWDASSDAFG